MTCSFHLVPPASLRADRGQEHGRTIPLADSGGHRLFGGAPYNMLQSSIGRRSPRVKGPQAAGTSEGGQVIVEGAPVAKGREAQATQAGGYRFFAG